MKFSPIIHLFFRSPTLEKYHYSQLFFQVFNDASLHAKMSGTAAASRCSLSGAEW
jgi:hypothetical protein